jgi:hypothetical protein
VQLEPLQDESEGIFQVLSYMLHDHFPAQSALTELTKQLCIDMVSAGMATE